MIVEKWFGPILPRITADYVTAITVYKIQIDYVFNVTGASTIQHNDSLRKKSHTHIYLHAIYLFVDKNSNIRQTIETTKNYWLTLSLSLPSPFSCPKRIKPFAINLIVLVGRRRRTCLKSHLVQPMCRVENKIQSYVASMINYFMRVKHPKTFPKYVKWWYRVSLNYIFWRYYIITVVILVSVNKSVSHCVRRAK